MTSFVPSSASPATASLDPTKHVNYTLGMVLGVDDFTQEFAYLSGRDQELARTLGGYGTVSGLRVTVEGSQVVVSPGVAISPSGQLIRVTPAQCADINKWLAAHTQDIVARMSSPPASGVNLYVVLRYRQCPTDMLPVPGEPCRTESDSMAASRWADEFQLELWLDPPHQPEEQGVRQFFDWLIQRVTITDIGTNFVSIEDFEKAVRNSVSAGLIVTEPIVLGPPAGGPSLATDPSTLAQSASASRAAGSSISLVVTSPPDSIQLSSPPTSPFLIRTADARKYLGAALRIWVTDLLPQFRPDRTRIQRATSSSSAPDLPGAGDWLSLAKLDIPISPAPGTDAWQAQDLTKIVVRENKRPYCLNLRTLQESLICGAAAGTGLKPNVTKIIALSWTHNAASPLVQVTRLTSPPTQVPGLAVAFGSKVNSPSPVFFGQGSLDEHTFEVFLLQPHTAITSPPTATIGECYVRLPKFRPAAPQGAFFTELIPVHVTVDPTTGQITGIIQEVARTQNPTIAVNGAAFVFSADLISQLQGREIYVKIRGDLIFDTAGHSLDADLFIRGGPAGGAAVLPTGDGVEGGDFWSWFTVTQRIRTVGTGAGSNVPTQ